MNVKSGVGVKSNTQKNKILDLRYSSYFIKDLCIAFFIKASSLDLLGLQVIQSFLDHSKNCFTNSFKQSVSLHMCNYGGVVRIVVIARSFRKNIK